MTCLCYCIHSSPGPEPAPPLAGVGGGPVYQVTHRRLRAAVSRINRQDLTPDLSGSKAINRWCSPVTSKVR
jgi:hypothetical protein